MGGWERDAAAVGFDGESLEVVADYVARGAAYVDGAPIEVAPGYWVLPGSVPYDGHTILAAVDRRP